MEVVQLVPTGEQIVVCTGATDHAGTWLGGQLVWLASMTGAWGRQC